MARHMAKAIFLLMQAHVRAKDFNYYSGAIKPDLKKKDPELYRHVLLNRTILKEDPFGVNSRKNFNQQV
jgi:hypothetical protein